MMIGTLAVMVLLGLVTPGVTSVRAETLGEMPFLLEEFPEILSYQELVLLSPQVRAEYLAELRETLLEMERRTSVQDVAVIEPLRRRLFALLHQLEMLPAAEAADVPLPRRRPESGDSVMNCAAVTTGSGRSAAMAAVRSGTGKQQRCIRGGFFSKISSAGGNGEECAPVTTFPAKAGQSQLKLSCASPGKSMCQPILYCGQRGGDGRTKPFCYGQKDDPRRFCKASMEKEERRSKQKCDPFNESVFGKIPALQDEFGELKSNWKSLCQDRVFAARFCEECDLMGKRLRKANARARAPSGASAQAADRRSRNPYRNAPYNPSGATYCTPWPSCATPGSGYGSSSTY